MSSETSLLPASHSAHMAIPIGPRGIIIADMDNLARFAKMVFHSGLAPTAFKNVEAIGVAVQHGLELGLSPMQALHSIAVINGKPGIYGDAALGLVEASGLLEDFEEFFQASDQRIDDPKTFPDELCAVCVSKRRSRIKPTVKRFSVGDAKRAGLWSKQGPWTNYPARMLMWRARGFCLRDAFPDVLKGFKTIEELQDYASQKPTPVPVSAAPTNGSSELSNGGQARTKTDRLAKQLAKPLENSRPVSEPEMRELGVDPEEAYSEAT